jgi:hypothetical protein
MPLNESKLEGIHINNNETTSTLKWDGNGSDQYAAVQASDAWKVDISSTTIYYYEIFVKEIENAVGVGLALAGFPTTTKMPGWTPGSYAYHGDDGQRFNGGSATAGWPLYP